MKNFNTTQILLFVATLFSGVSLIAQPACNQFNYFYADISYPSSGKQTDIYSVNFETGVADLTSLSEDLPYGGHVAYNEIEKLIYIVNDNDGSVQTLDPSTGDLSVVTYPSIPLSQVSAATISVDGKLLLGSHDGTIYQAKFNTNPYTVTVFDGGADISGGDLVFNNVGLYLASKPNGYFYAVFPGMYNVLLGYVTDQVTGLAKFEDGATIIASGQGNSSFLQYDIDGSVTEINSYAAMLNGEPFTMGNGDLTSGCSSFQTVEETCANFQYFYIADNTPGIPSGTIYGGNIVGSDFVMTELFQSGLSGHMAVNNNNGDIYVMRNNRIKTFSTTGVLLNNVVISGFPSGLVAAVWNPLTNLLYVASASAGKVYELNPADGSYSLFASGIPVNGGDLVINNDGELFLVKRINSGSSKLYNISSGSAVLVGNVAPAINGAALTADGGFIMAQGNGSTSFHLYDADGTSLSVLNSVDNLGNTILLKDGDMASGCMSNESLEVPDNGNCNATEVIEYIQGTSKTGGAIAANRTDATQALGAPERAGQNVFVSLGYGGSLVLAFDGAIPNGPGDDIEVVETSYGNPSCAAYPEFADVYVSVDGLAWFFAKTICRTDGFVDISDAGTFDYVNFVKIVNNNDLSTTPDGFDVDGVVAIHNCIGDVNPPVIESGFNLSGQLTAFPNPSSGVTTVQFATVVNGKTTLEVLDMNGRVVKTLFSKEVVAGELNKVDFDASGLPNGIYITKMVTNNETVIEKLMIAR